MMQKSETLSYLSVASVKTEKWIVGLTEHLPFAETPSDKTAIPAFIVRVKI